MLSVFAHSRLWIGDSTTASRSTTFFEVHCRLWWNASPYNITVSVYYYNFVFRTHRSKGSSHLSVVFISCCVSGTFATQPGTVRSHSYSWKLNFWMQILRLDRLQTPKIRNSIIFIQISVRFSWIVFEWRTKLISDNRNVKPIWVNIHVMTIDSLYNRFDREAENGCRHILRNVDSEVNPVKRNK